MNTASCCKHFGRFRLFCEMAITRKKSIGRKETKAMEEKVQVENVKDVEGYEMESEDVVVRYSELERMEQR